MGSLAKIIDATGASHEDLQSRANIFGIDLFCGACHGSKVVFCFSRSTKHDAQLYILSIALGHEQEESRGRK